MGSWKSNRWTQHRRKGLVEDSVMIGLSFFTRMGLSENFKFHGFYTWADMPKVNLEALIYPDEMGGLKLFLDAIYTPAGGFKIEQEADLFSVPMPKGGERWYFKCPMVKGRDGEYPIVCGHRCSVLYMPGGPGELQFGCRNCHNLTYRKSQTHSKRRDLLLRDPWGYIVNDLEKAKKKGNDLGEDLRELARLAQRGRLPPTGGEGSGGSMPPALA